MGDKNTLKRDFKGFEATHDEEPESAQQHGMESDLLKKKTKVEYPIKSSDDLARLHQRVQSISINAQESIFENRIKLKLPVVDKTAIIHALLKNTRSVALMGPRRFGKTFTVSTLEAIFTKGQEWWHEHCKDFEIVSKTDYAFDIHPVLRLDFASKNSVNILQSHIVFKLRNLFRDHGLDDLKDDCERYKKNPTHDLYKEILEQGTECLKRKCKKGLIILIDEFDYPITQKVEKILARDLRAKLEQDDELSQISSFTKDFLLCIKSLRGQDFVQFLYLTGGVPLSQYGLFSGANDQYQIRTEPIYLGLLGYSRKEILKTFDDHLLNAAFEDFSFGKKEIKPEELTEQDMNTIQTKKTEILGKIAEHYNGFLFHFSQEESSYSPYSINMLFQSWQSPRLNSGRVYDCYFAASGSSGLIFTALKLSPLSTIQTFFWSILSEATQPLAQCTKNDLTNNQTVASFFKDPMKLCFLSGVFTIDQSISTIDVWRFKIVNLEMREALLAEIANVAEIPKELGYILVSLSKGDYQQFFESCIPELEKLSVFVNVFQNPNEPKKDDLEVEAYGHTIFAVLLDRLVKCNERNHPNAVTKIPNQPYLSNFKFTKDRALSTSNSRPDILISFNNEAIIIEFKCRASVGVALEEAKKDLDKKFKNIVMEPKVEYSYLKDCKKTWIAGAIGFGVLQAMDIYEHIEEKLELKEQINLGKIVNQELF